MNPQADCQALQATLLQFFDDRSEALAWCAAGSAPLKLLRNCLAQGVRQWHINVDQIGTDPPLICQIQHQWAQTYKRQTSCPSDFAWLDLKAKPLAQKGVILEWGVEQVLPEWGGSNQPIADDSEVLWLLPALLKGLIDGLRQVKIQGLHLRINGMRLHLVDSRPRSYYLCAFQAMENLAVELQKRQAQEQSI